MLGLSSEEASSSPKDDGLAEVNEPTRLALLDEPFSSVRQIARNICASRNAVYHRLVDSLQFTFIHQTSDIRYLHWIPRKLSDSQKANRVVDSTSRPPVVHPASRMGRGYILAVGE
jgi:hypothetical protein